MCQLIIMMILSVTKFGKKVTVKEILLNQKLRIGLNAGACAR